MTSSSLSSHLRAADLSVCLEFSRADRAGMDPAGPETQPLLVGDYPLWMVGLAVGLALALLCWLLARAFRVLAVLVAVGVVVGACFLAWQHLLG